MRRNYLMAGAAIVAATLVVTAIVYPHLPAVVPVHWNIHNQVDRYGPRWNTLVIVPAIMVFMIALMAALPWLSPRRYEVDGRSPAYLQIMLVTLLFLAAVHFVTLAASLGYHVDIGKAVVGGICAMTAVFGVLLPKVPRNFYVGIRTPWTLASPEVWEATHRFAGKTFLAGGVAGVALALLLPVPWPALAVMSAGAVAPVFHSLVYYKRLERRGEV